MAASIVPLLLVAGGVALMLGGKKKAKKIAPGIPKGEEDQIEKTYAQAMHPDAQDLRFLAQVRDWLRRQGRADLAANVASKIASIEAGIAAREAAEARQRAIERKRWEVEQKQPPLGAEQANALYAKVMDPNFEGSLSQIRFALGLLRLYGTPKQVAAVTRKIAELEAKEAPIETVQPEPEPEVRIPPGEIPPEPETEDPFEPPPPLTKAPPTKRFPDTDEPPAPPLAKELPVEKPIPDKPPEVPPPLAEEEVEPKRDPHGTIALARLLINREATAGWKTANQAEVTSWQARVGLKPDGKFGPGSLLRMAREVGILPRIRYYPKGTPTKAIGIKRVRRDLFTLAANLEEAGKVEHAAALRLSAEAEKGQGWPTKPKAEPVATRTEEARLLAVALDVIKQAKEIVT